jgi:outer membrane protein insertion porin family
LSAAAEEQNLIREIRVEGCNYGSPEEVRAAALIATGADVTKDDTVMQIREDVRAIYKLPFVRDVTVIGEQVAGGVRLTFIIDENPRIDKIELVGNEKINDDDLLQEIGFIESSWIFGRKRAGAFFYTPYKADEIKKKILDKYTGKGFPTGAGEHETQLTWTWQPTTDNTGVLTFHITEGKVLKIHGVRFIGAAEFSSKELKKKIKSKKSWFPFFKKKFKSEDFEEDLRRVEMMYKERGYLNVKAKQGKFETTENGKGLIVVMDISEGTQFRIGKIDSAGNEAFSDAETLEVVKSVPGEICNWVTLSDDVYNITDLYKGQGYLHVVISPDLIQHEQEARVDVRLVVREGPRIYLGNVYIRAVEADDKGNVTPVALKTKPYVFLREIRLESGEVLDWDEIRESERRLVNLGYFEEDPEWGKDKRRLLYGFHTEGTETENVEDLVLTVKEIQTGMLSFGVGYNTVYGSSIFTSVTENNLFGRGQTGRISTELGERRNAVNLSWTEPYLLGSDYLLGANVFYRAYEAYGGRRFDEDRYGFGLRLGKKLSDEVRASLYYRFEYVDISEIDDDKEIVLERPSFYEDRNLTTSSLTFSLNRDTRDYVDFPTRGTEGDISLEGAGIGGDTNFFRLTTEGSWYHQLAEKLVLALNGQMGAAFPFGKTDVLPLHERFFVGGANSVRGFNESGIGPHELYLRAFPDPQGMLEVDDEGHVILDRDYVNVGGESFSEAHIELRYRVLKQFDVATFFDAGTAGMDAGDIFSDYRLSTGAGFRVKLPFTGGSVRLDYGIPIVELEHDEGQNFHFSFGQQF